MKVLRDEGMDSKKKEEEPEEKPEVKPELKSGVVEAHDEVSMKVDEGQMQQVTVKQVVDEECVLGCGFSERENQ